MKAKGFVPIEQIGRAIYLIRGQRVMMDSDLARIYGVTTTRLNQQVNRNRKRFPEDFVFRLTRREFDNLMLQIATSSLGYGGRRKLPYVFTEHGAIMLASVLNAAVAVQASVQVVRAFVRLREIIASDKGLAEELARLEEKLANHEGRIETLFDAIERLANSPEPPRRQIGFHLKGENF